MTQQWRVGRSVGRTVYEGDKLIGLMDTPEQAATVVEAVNQFNSPPPAHPGTTFFTDRGQVCWSCNQWFPANTEFLVRTGRYDKEYHCGECLAQSRVPGITGR